MIILLPCYFESRTVTKYSYKNRYLKIYAISKNSIPPATKSI